MGRRKIEIKKINNSKRAHSTFSKRKRGFFKKMDDLSDLTGADVCCIMQTPANNYFWHTAGEKIDEMEEMIPIIIKSIDKNAETQSHFFQNKRNKKNFKYTKEMKAKLHKSGELAANLSRTPTKKSTCRRATISLQLSETDEDDESLEDSFDDDSYDTPPRRITTRSSARRASHNVQSQSSKMDISLSLEDNISPEQYMADSSPPARTTRSSKRTAGKKAVQPPSFVDTTMEQQNIVSTSPPSSTKDHPFVLETPTAQDPTPTRKERRKFATGMHDASEELLMQQYGSDDLGHILTSPSFSTMISPINPSASSLISPSNSKADFMVSSSPSNAMFTSPKGTALSFTSPRNTFTSPRASLRSPPSGSSSRQIEANMTDMDTPKSMRNMPWRSHTDDFALNDIFGSANDPALFFGVDE